MKSGWSYYRDTDGNDVKHAPKTLISNVYAQEAETEGLQSLLDTKLQNKAGVIQTTHIADRAVTGTKLANEAVKDEHIAAAQISPSKIANLAQAVVTAVQDKLEQVTSGVMTGNELYRQVVLAIKTAIENAEIEGTDEDALRGQIVSAVREAFQNMIETSQLNASYISAGQASVTAMDAAQLSTEDLVVSGNAAVNALRTSTLNATRITLEKAEITDLETQMARAESLLADAAVIGLLSTGEFALCDENGSLCRLKVTDGGKVEAVEGGISGEAIADASLAGSKIVEGSITAAKINVGDLFASEAFINKLKTHLIEAEGLDIIIKQTDEMFGKLKMFFQFTEDGLDIHREGSDFKVHLDEDELSFMHKGSIIADINNGRMNIQKASVAGTLSIGKHTWDAEANSSLSLVWNGVE